MSQLEFDLSANGLRCPDCGSGRLTTEQTLIGHNSILRRRKCANGHTFISREVVGTRAEFNSADRTRQKDRRTKEKKD